MRFLGLRVVAFLGYCAYGHQRGANVLGDFHIETGGHGDSGSREDLHGYTQPTADTMHGYNQPLYVGLARPAHAGEDL
jgi:hypothetical protein